MMKKKIDKFGLYQAPEKFEVEILLHASQNISHEPETEVWEYFSWLPLVGLMLILRDFLTGSKVRISPEIKL